MFNVKKYRLTFDIFGFIVFAIIMIPNLIWFAVPAGNDILRNESITPTLDIAASVFQVIMVVSLCLIANSDYQKPKSRKWIISIIASMMIYFLGWGMYYYQIVTPVVIMILCIVPCMTFLIFSIGKKNGVAFVSATLFMICHVIYGVLNFTAR